MSLPAGYVHVPVQVMPSSLGRRNCNMQNPVGASVEVVLPPGICSQQCAIPGISNLACASPFPGADQPGKVL